MIIITSLLEGIVRIKVLIIYKSVYVFSSYFQVILFPNESILRLHILLIIFDSSQDIADNLIITGEIGPSAILVHFCSDKLLTRGYTIVTINQGPDAKMTSPQITRK